MRSRCSQLGSRALARTIGLASLSVPRTSVMRLISCTISSCRDAAVVYADASDRVGDDYRSGTSRPQMIAVVVVGGVVFAGLIVTQVFAYKRTKRVFNLGLVLASVLLVAVVATSILRTSASESDLIRAQREGSDSVQLLAASRILALRAQSASTLAVIDRQPDSDALGYAAALGDESGGGALLAEVAPIIERNGDASESDQLTAAFSELRDTIAQVQGLLDHRAFTEAESLVLGDQAAHAELLDQRLETEIADAQARVRDATRDARAGFAVVVVVMSIATLLAAVAVAFGLKPRIAEYR